MELLFTLTWAKLFEKGFGGVAEEFTYKKDNKIVSYAFIKRCINQLPFAQFLKEKYYDIVSPYGYGGIFISDSAQKDPIFLRQFEEKFSDYCAKQNIIAEFVRFHPFQKNHLLFKDYYLLKKANDNIYIDLSESEDIILMNMEKRHRYSIRKAEKSGAVVKFDDDFQYLNQFKKLYKETNDRNQASRFYYFSDEFFDRLIKDFTQNIKLVIAELNGEVVAASLFIFGEKEVYYFLSGANKTGLNSCANYLILRQIISDAKHSGKSIFNLGGTLSNNTNLFLFKSGFSKTMAPFYVGTKIYNNIVYDKLIDLFKVGGEKTDYFPLYRYHFQDFKP